jgi:hypothetical protein
MYGPEAAQEALKITFIAEFRGIFKSYGMGDRRSSFSLCEPQVFTIACGVTGRSILISLLNQKAKF